MDERAIEVKYGAWLGEKIKHQAKDTALAKYVRDALCAYEKREGDKEWEGLEEVSLAVDQEGLETKNKVRRMFSYSFLLSFLI